MSLHSIVLRLQAWRQQRVFWHRFTHGRCTQCGHSKPVQGMTVCPHCFLQMTKREAQEHRDQRRVQL